MFLNEFNWFFSIEIKLSFSLGLLLFADSFHIQYDLVKVGISPLGYSAVCWSLNLNGNIDLSILLAIVNTMPFFGKLWFHVVHCCNSLKKIRIHNNNNNVFQNSGVFMWMTFGKFMLAYLFDEINEVDNRLSDKTFFVDFATSTTITSGVQSLCIIISFCIGLLLQYKFPRSQEFILPILKPISHIYLLFYYSISFFCMNVKLFKVSYILSKTNEYIYSKISKVN